MAASLNTQSAALIDRIINFHAQQSQEISLTKLYQLLYLIDFGHCALHGVAVSHFEYFGHKNELGKTKKIIYPYSTEQQFYLNCILLIISYLLRNLKRKHELSPSLEGVGGWKNSRKSSPSLLQSRGD